MSKEVKTEKLVSAGTIAKEILGISKRSFWRLRSQGKIGPKALKIGGSLRFKLSEILQWIEWDCCDMSEFKARKEGERC